MGLLEELILLVNDGEWHNPTDLASRLGAAPYDVRAALNLLARYGLIRYDKLKTTIRTTPLTQRCVEDLAGWQ